MKSTAIKEEYLGFIILASGELDLLAKRRSIRDGDTRGFYSVEEWHKTSHIRDRFSNYKDYKDISSPTR